jgi:predicted DNA binding CopG/RHH family protein
MKRFDPFKNLVLDDEEKEIEAAVKRGEYVSAPNFKERKRILKEAAENYLASQKTKPITIRVRESDLLKVKFRAKDKNMPYQTLLKTLIHEHTEGRARVEL